MNQKNKKPGRILFGIALACIWITLSGCRTVQEPAASTLPALPSALVSESKTESDSQAATDPDLLLTNFDASPPDLASPAIHLTPGDDTITDLAPLVEPPPGEIPVEPVLPGVGGAVKAGCATCGGSGLGSVTDRGYSSCSTCGGSGCVPGRKPGSAFESHTVVGRAFGNLYEALCCPDPCYEPSWIPAANAGFSLDYARPRTLMRLRYDHVQDMLFPDRNEFFWARENIGNGGGRGPGRPARVRNDARFRGERSLNYDSVSIYQEAAAGPRSSFFVEIPYLSVDPLITNHHSGFGDINIGTKAVLFDTELLLITFQFRTFLPVGNTAEGLGTGHVSLEPSILTTLRLATHTYLQGQLAEWIPIGGDPTYQGSILESRLSFNQVLYQITPQFPLIGTLEGSAWSFQTGAYTDPTYFPTPQRYSGNATYFNFGPGLRASVCDRVDFGGFISWPIGQTPGHIGDPVIRFEVRFLF